MLGFLGLNILAKELTAATTRNAKALLRNQALWYPIRQNVNKRKLLDNFL